MGIRVNWPVVQQLTGPDGWPGGWRVESARSKRLRARTATADRWSDRSAPTARSAAGRTSTSRTARSSRSRGIPTRRQPGAALSQGLGQLAAHHRLGPPHGPLPAPTAPSGRPGPRDGDGHGRRPGAGGPPRRGMGGRRRRVRRTMGLASLGGATLDNEENYLIKKLFTALGVVQVENQARICHSLDGRGSRDLVRARRGDDLPAGPAELRLHRHRGVEHGGGPPGRLPVGDGGEGARRHGHPRRSPLHPDQRRCRPPRPDPRRDRHRLPRRASSTTSWRTTSGSTSTWLDYTNASTIVDERVRRHRGPRRALLWLRRGEPPLRHRLVAVRGRPGRPRRRADGPTKSDDARRRSGSAHGESHGSGGARSTGEPDRDPTLAAPALRPPDPQAPLRPLHARDGRARSAGSPRISSPGLPRRSPSTPGATARRAFVYAVGWTQHTVGVQYIRAASVLQLLLGNIGRPGGGIHGAARPRLASRARPTSRRCSTSCPATCRCPTPTSTQDLDDYRRRRTRRTRGTGRTCVVPGQPAQGVVGRRRDRGQRVLLRLSAPAHRRPPHLRHGGGQIDGALQGYFLLGREPGGGVGQRARCSAWGWRTSSGWWCGTSPHRERHVVEGRPRDRGRRDAHRGHRDRGLLLPGRGAHREGAAAFTNTQRMLQWHHQAVEPEGDARSELWFIYHLGRIIREKLAGLDEPRGPARPGPHLGLPHRRPASPSPSAEAVLAEINGCGRGRRARSRRYSELRTTASPPAAAGSTAGSMPTGSTSRRGASPRTEQNWLGAEWGWAWPANRRILYNRASADPEGKPWSERKALVWWDDERRHAGPATTCPTFPPTKAAGVPARAGARRGSTRSPVTTRSSCRPTGEGWLYAPSGLVDGPLPTHYEPEESPVRNAALRSAAQPGPQDRPHDAAQPLPPERGRGRSRGLPVRAHHLPAHRALHRRRDEPLVAVPLRAAARDVLRGLPGAGRASGAWSTPAGRRSSPPAARSRPACWSPSGCGRST